MMRRAMLCAVMVLVTAATAAAQAPVFVLRHAERADAGRAGGTMGNDPDLSEAGRARAQSLAAALKDAGITAIFATEFKRTQQTAAPLASALGIPVTKVPAKDTAALIAKIKAATGAVLVVGHSDTVPDIVKMLGVATPVTVGDADFDNLFIVTRGRTPSVIRLHYR